MKTLVALDGSTTKTGYAIYKVYDNNTFALKKSGVLEPPKQKKKKSKKDTIKIKKESRTESMAFRMFYLLDSIYNLVEEEKTLGYIVIEDTFLGKDANAYKWLCRLQGFLMGYSKVKNIIYETMYPTHWRSILSIATRDKDHVFKRDELKKKSWNYIKLLGLKADTEDECEAVLIGRAYLIEKGYKPK